MSVEEPTIYIAGSSKEIPTIQGFIQAVRDYGYVVTFDWTTTSGWDVPDDRCTNDQHVQDACTDLDAVRRSDVVWYCASQEESGKSEGSASELGMALALNKIVLTSGPLNRTRIFPRLAQHVFARHSQALECLRTRAWMTDEQKLWLALVQHSERNPTAPYLVDGSVGPLHDAFRALLRRGLVYMTAVDGTFHIWRAW